MRRYSQSLPLLTLTAVMTILAHGARAEVPPASAPSGGVRTVCDFGAVGDGKADDTAALERAVQAGGDVHFPRGVYRITRSITIDLDKLGPNVFDRNSNYWDPQGGDNALLVRNSRDVTLTGLHVNGAKGSRAGLMVENCHRVNVTNCTILDCASAGLLLENAVHCRVSDCLIRNDRPDAGPWQPLVVNGGRGNMIVDNLLGGRLEVDSDSAQTDGNEADR